MQSHSEVLGVGLDVNFGGRHSSAHTKNEEQTQAGCLFQDQNHEFYAPGSYQKSLTPCEKQTLWCYRTRCRPRVFLRLNSLVHRWQPENGLLKHRFLKICEKISLPVLQNIIPFSCLHGG